MCQEPDATFIAEVEAAVDMFELRQKNRHGGVFAAPRSKLAQAPKRTLELVQGLLQRLDVLWSHKGVEG